MGFHHHRHSGDIRMNIADEIVWLAVAAGRAACRRKVVPTTEAELFAFTKGAFEQHIQAVCDALTGAEEPRKTEGCNVCGQPLHMGCCNPERPVRFVRDGEGRAVEPMLLRDGSHDVARCGCVLCIGYRHNIAKANVHLPPYYKPPAVVGIDPAREGADESSLVVMTFDESGPRILAETSDPAALHNLLADTFEPHFPEACTVCASPLRGDHKNGERCPECGNRVVLV
jgi:hypothetical protein